MPHMRLDDEISVATTNNVTQAGSEGMAHTDEDDGGKENTTWVSTASGVHDNACLSKGIVVRLGRLELPRPKALEPKSSASANSATGASGGNHTVACGFVKVPARAQLKPASAARHAHDQTQLKHATAHGPHPAHTHDLTRPLR